jgi:hypothetical protein
VEINTRSFERTGYQRKEHVTVTTTVALPAGLHVLTLNEGNSGWNIDCATFAVQ